MKIAFLLTNHVRTNVRSIEDLKENLNYVFSQFDATEIDFFYSTWFSEDVDFTKLKEVLELKVLDIETEDEYCFSTRKYASDFEVFIENYKNNSSDYNYFSAHSMSNNWKGGFNIFYKLDRGLRIIKDYEKKNGLNYQLKEKIV